MRRVLAHSSACAEEMNGVSFTPLRLEHPVERVGSIDVGVETRVPKQNNGLFRLLVKDSCTNQGMNAIQTQTTDIKGSSVRINT